MEFKHIELITEEEIATFIFNRPEVHNALNDETVQELLVGMERIEQDDQIRVIIFTGVGEKSFAAGADINEIKECEPLDVFRNSMTRLYRMIETSKKATIAAINGYALGGGLELALACDIRIASLNAKIGLPELNLAVIPGAGGTQRLSRIVGKGIAMDMILTGEYLLAEEAKAIGLISNIVTQENLLDTAKEKAKRIAKKGPLAIQMAKLAIHKGQDVDIETGLLIENLLQGLLYGTNDKVVGTTAFLEKRTAAFSGK